MIDLSSDIRWRTLIALPVLVLATVMGWYWVWGCLFLYWVWPALRSGQAYLIEPIERARDPLLFWLVNALWAGFGLWYIVTDLSRLLT